MSAASFMARFQSTLPYGSETVAICSLQMTSISIHAPLRERTFAQIIISREGNFNPRSLTGATVSDEILRTSLGFQSTLPYGSDGQRRDFTDIARISIHAPLRERSLRQAFMLQRYYISIHAPLRERRFGFSCRSDCFSFQSTLPYGSEEFADLPSSVRAISIHAPLRERFVSYRDL